MRSKKYLICILLAVSLLLQSCGIIIINEKDGGTTSSSESTNADKSTDAEEDPPKLTSTALKEKALKKLDKIPSYSFENETVTIFTTDDTFFYGDGKETVLNSDRVERIKLLEKKFSLSTRTVITDKENAHKKIAAAHKSGTPVGHIYALPADVTVTLIADGYLKSLRESAYFNENDTCFNSSVNAFTLGHDIFAVSGDGCFEPDKIYALYYNKAKLDSLNLTPISTLVSSDEWTFDKYVEYKAAAEASGYEKTISATTASIPFEEMVLLTSGFKFSDNIADKPIRLNSFSKDFADFCTSAKKFINGGSPVKSEIGDFTSGNVMFFTDVIANTEKYTSMSDTWSIAPHPKYSADAEYASYISMDAVLLSMPSTTESTEGIGAFITALNTSSEGHVITRYIEQNMNYIVRDNGALNGLGIAINNVNYDFAYIFSTSFDNLNKYTVEAYKQIIANELTYQEYVDAYQTTTEEYFDKFFPVKYY